MTRCGKGYVCLGDNILNYIAVNISEPEVSAGKAVSQSFMVKAEPMQDCRV